VPAPTWENARVDHARPVLLRRGLRLEYATLGWNVVGVAVLAVAAVRAGSVALAGFGLDSAIEIGASIVVVRELLGDEDPARERTALRRIGAAFVALAVYVTVQAAVVLAGGSHPGTSGLGIAWTAATAVLMAGLACGKAVTGRRLGHAVLRTEARVTLVDAYLATAVLAGLLLNAGAGWWWADPLAGLVVVAYAIREARNAFGHTTVSKP
jgi:divalent metal cation (Fe/Co/Zn/Cd) transporter